MADGVRIGNAEREAATAELGRHLEAGRLDPDEYADRVTRASAARTQGELDPLFSDLPRPGAKVPITQSGELADARHSELATRLWAVSGTSAVVIYMIIGFAFDGWGWGWIVFLIGPILATLLGGTGKSRRERRGR